MEIKGLIQLMTRNVRYIILGLVLGAGLGIVISKVQTPVYEASAKVFVSQQSKSGMLSLSDEQLLAINLQLVKSQPVLDDVSSKIGSKIDVDNIQAGPVPNTLIIQIKVQDIDQQRASMIANLLVQALMQHNENLLTERYTELENTINSQTDQVQKQIDSLQTQISQVSDTGIQEQLTQVNQQIEQLKTEISGIEQEIAGFPNTLSPLDVVTLTEKQAKLDQLHSLMSLYQGIQTNLTYTGKPGQSGSSLENPRLATLQSTLNLYQQLQQTLITNRENIRLARAQSGQNLMQIVSATPPKIPVRPIPVLYFLLGGIVGLALAVTAILIMDHMDDSLKSAEQIEGQLGLPVLGFVFENKHTDNGMIGSSDPFSTEAEAFRALGASLEIISAGKGVRSLMIVNAGPTDVRTTIAANLAVINAQQGKQVILVDGDLKRPHLHSLFEMENKMGLAELLGDTADLAIARHALKNREGLTLIPSGVAEKNSNAWLNVDKWEQILFALQKRADLVIVDGPLANAADAQILASKMDAVLLVIRLGFTHIDAAQAALRRFQLIGARVTGVILNCTLRSQMTNKQIFSLIKIKQQHREDFQVVNSETDTIHVLPS